MKLCDLANLPIYYASNCCKSIYENKNAILKTAVCIGTAIAIGAYIKNSPIFPMRDCFRNAIDHIPGSENTIDGGGMSCTGNVKEANECFPGFTPFKLSYSFSRFTSPSKETMLKEVGDLYNEATYSGMDLFSTYGYSASLSSAHSLSAEDFTNKYSNQTREATFLICKQNLLSQFTTPW